MSIKAFFTVLLIGALAGWIAGIITKRSGFGPLGNVIVGIAGALIAQFAFGYVGISAHNFLGQLIFAVLGALIFVYLLGFIKR
jgi:uncharacterized membrane protein YeaQ/YmgE (transglycosylase-associated protein family)